MKNIYWKILFCQLLLLSAIFVTAQPRTRLIGSQLVTQSSFLWMITGKELKDTSYMYGTFHILCKNDFKLPVAITNRLSRTKTFFLETLPVNRLSTAYLVKNDTSLKDRIGAVYFEKVKKIVSRKYTISEDTLNRMWPLILSMYVSRAAMSCETTSYDEELFKIAEKKGKKIAALETREEHMKPIYAIPLQRQAMTLKVNLDHLEKIDSVAKQRITMYLNKQLPIYNNEIFLDQRNILWVPLIERSIHQQPCFFAFGCAHLFGTTGMINALKAKGYSVTPVMY